MLPESSKLIGQSVSPEAPIAIRATLVVGVIAAILAVRLDPQLNHPGPMASEILSLTKILLLYWGLYAATMAGGIETKPFGEKIAEYCKKAAYNFFMTGSGFTFMALLLVALDLLLPTGMLIRFNISVGQIGGISLRFGFVGVLGDFYRIWRTPNTTRAEHLTFAWHRLERFLYVALFILPVFLVP